MLQTIEPSIAAVDAAAAELKMPSQSDKAFFRKAWPFLVLALLTVAAYLGTFRNDFVDYDDDRYLTANPVVQRGLSLRGVWYAFTTFDTGNWIPLTWLSFELDASLFGLHPAGFHGVNLLLHTINVLLLYVWLKRLSISTGCSLAAAAIFAVHPLHVESVAWMSERKDVLSTLFLLLVVLQYQRFAERPNRQRYLLALGFFLLGLLAKPMLITVPALLFLLDFWPLRRCQDWTLDRVQRSVPAVSLRQLCLEKLPFALLATALLVVTFFAQRSDLSFVDTRVHPWPARLANAVCSGAWYLEKTFWPTSLCIYYPLDFGNIDTLQVAWSAGLLGLITLAAIGFARQQPGMLFGWLWFVVSLAPVIGLVQIGAQAHADRYTYVPHLGLCVALGFAAMSLLARWPRTKIFQAVGACTIVVVCSILTFRQVDTWRDSRTLWTHANETAPDNWMALFHLSIDRLQARQPATARELIQQSIEIQPGNPDTRAILGKTYLNEQRWDEARQVFLENLSQLPRHRDSLIGMAVVCHACREYRDAEGYLLVARDVDPINSYVLMQLGLLYAQAEKTDAALEQFDAVLRLVPRNIAALKAAGQVLARAGRTDAAIVRFQAALKVLPQDPESHVALARLFDAQGDLSSSERHADAARRLTTTKPRSKIVQTSGVMGQ
ncbi:tetratricopeptide repeat protein [Planctomicrobium piriforme]|uniref:Tetratricopeptide repeat-containing protein n=1 Tax=Planctomicrobium piriforme TaxID=1576369 RepID=A0A1I3F461_9PLAN|nr:tetratricopeptide repeat protein [Planctomicrobium piriforme]SFI06025.1 Tetratricopeptide repeat-containing protein [Planctomicrobium piriforme]